LVIRPIGILINPTEPDLIAKGGANESIIESCGHTIRACSLSARFIPTNMYPGIDKPQRVSDTTTVWR
jgi:hypothetical protein